MNAPQSPAVPQLTPEQQRAAFDAMDWGVLQPLVNAYWLDRETGAYAALLPNMANGRLDLSLFESSRYFVRAVKMQIKPGPTPDQFFLRIEKSNEILADDEGLVRFDETGRMHPVSGGIRPEVKLVVNKEVVSFERPRSHGMSDTKVNPLKMARDFFTLPDGRKVWVSSDPDSEYQQLRKGRLLGMWEYYIGNAYISQYLTVKLKSNEPDRLELEYISPGGKRPGLYIYKLAKAPPGQMQSVAILGMPNHKPEDFKVLRAGMTNVDRLFVQYEETKNWLDNGRYGNTYILRGDWFMVGGYHRRSDQGGSEGYGYTDVYLPITEERVLATLKEQARRDEEAERRRNAPPPQRTDYTAAIIAGMQSGFAQAQQISQRDQMRTERFERELNHRLRATHEAQQRKQAAEIVAELSKEQSAASRVQTQTGPTQRSAGSNDSAASAAAAQQKSIAAEKTKQLQAAKQAEKARQAEQEREAAARKKQEAAQQKLRDAELDKQRQAQALGQQLLVEKRQIRMRALQCPGKDGFPSVTGTRPRVQPSVASCVTVHFEARCPSERPGTGMQGSIWAFQGMNNCTEDSGALPRKLACEPAQAIVEVTNVTVCN